MNYLVKRKFKNVVLALLLLSLLSIIILFINNKDKANLLVDNIEANDLDIVYGVEQAPIQIFYFFDYSCVHCRNFLLDVFPKLKKAYIDQGLVNFNLKILSFTNSLNLENAYKTIICLNQYGNFEELHELMLTEPEVVFSKEFEELIEDYISRNSYFADCMLSGHSDNYLKENLNLFVTNQFSGTPIIIINNRFYKGYMNFEKIKKIIDKELSKL